MDSTTWSSAVAKGRELYQLMLSPDTTQGQSPFTSISALAHEYNGSKRNMNTTMYQAEASALNDIIPNIADDYQVKVYRPRSTENISFYILGTSISKRALVAVSARSPLYYTSIINPAAPLPNLRHWSDVASLHWKAAVQEDTEAAATMKELKYVLRHSVINDQAQEVLKVIASQNEGKVDSNHPLVFEADDDQFFALLATPNGRSTVRLLADHKVELGLKVIERITVYWEDKELEDHQCPNWLLELRYV